jgi:hypothetical protein
MSVLEILNQEIAQVKIWHTELLQITTEPIVRQIAHRMEPKLHALLNVITDQERRIQRLELLIHSTASREQ